VQRGAAARCQLSVDRVADQRVLKPQPPGEALSRRMPDATASSSAGPRSARPVISASSAVSMRSPRTLAASTTARVCVVSSFARRHQMAQLGPLGHQPLSITVRRQVLGGKPDEQRIAAGALPQCLGELPVGRSGQLRQPVCDGLPGQPAERQRQHQVAGQQRGRRVE
jgi:hypothetical protein